MHLLVFYFGLFFFVECVLMMDLGSEIKLALGFFFRKINGIDADTNELCFVHSAAGKLKYIS